MPAYRETIHLLMQELGPQTDSIDAVIQHETDSWAVQFDDESIVLLEYAKDPDRLVFSTELGSPPPERRLEACQLLLSYNLLWQESGGLKTALGGPDGGALLLLDWMDAEPKLTDLQGRLEHFCRLAAAWRSYISNGTEVDQTLAASGLSNFV